MLNRSQSPEAIDVDHYADVRGEIALWTAVIVRALLDASYKGHKAEERIAKRKALVWLREYGPFFIEVCDMAMLDPEITYVKIQRALERDCVWRLPNGQGWRSKIRDQLAKALEIPDEPEAQ